MTTMYNYYVWLLCMTTMYYYYVLLLCMTTMYDYYVWLLRMTTMYDYLEYTIFKNDHTQFAYQNTPFYTGQLREQQQKSCTYKMSWSQTMFDEHC